MYVYLNYVNLLQERQRLDIDFTFWKYNFFFSSTLTSESLLFIWWVSFEYLYIHKYTYKYTYINILNMFISNEIFMCLYMLMYVYICIHIHKHTSMYTFHAFADMYMYVSMYVYRYINVFVCTYIHKTVCDSYFSSNDKGDSWMDIFIHIHSIIIFICIFI